MSVAPLVVALVGASFVEPGSPMVDALGALLRDAHGREVRVVGLGKRGRSLAAWLSAVEGSRADLEVLRSSALVLVAEFGGNGIASADAIGAADRRLRQLSGGPVLWMEPPRPWPGSERVAAGREGAARELVASGVPRVRHLYAPARSHVAPDGAHLTREGFRALAGAVAPFASRRLRGTGGGWVPLVVALGVVVAVAGLIAAGSV